MEKISPEKSDRFRSLIHAILADIKHYASVGLLQRVSESYYMQKAEEFRVLRQQWDEARQKLDDVERRMALHYKPAYCRWRRDVRFIQHYKRAIHLTQQ